MAEAVGPAREKYAEECTVRVAESQDHEHKHISGWTAVTTFDQPAPPQYCSQSTMGSANFCEGQKKSRLRDWAQELQGSAQRLQGREQGFQGLAQGEELMTKQRASCQTEQQ